jgi:Fe-S-cluster containining protein
VTSAAISGKTVVDLGRPSTWTEYREGACVGCRALCCSLPVVVTPDDLVRLGVLPQARVMDSPKRVGKDLLAAGIVSEVTVWERTFLLAKTPGGPCIYLGEDRRCTVYDRRPSACRDFPSVGPKPGSCPQG